MAATTVTLRVRFAWWWTYIYWPLTVCAIRLGLPINPDMVMADARKAVRVETVSDGRL